MPKCNAKTKSGASCQMYVQTEDGKCHHHANECSICMNKIKHDERILECNHSFHIDCIKQWRQTGNYSCPVCREPFDVPMFKLKIEIQRIVDGETRTINTTESLLNSFINQMGMEDYAYSDVEADIDTDDDLRSILRDIGIPFTDFDSIPTDTE